MGRLFAHAVAIVAVAGGTGQAQDIDQFEHEFGATDVNAAIGNGRVTAGFSAQGEVTVLRWPSPSYYEHMNFVTSAASNARSLPHFGARDDMGSFAGVYVAPGPAGPGTFSWARDAGWTTMQAYAEDDTNQLVTSLHNATLRVTVSYTDDAAPDLDVLVRRVTVVPDAGFVPTAIRLVYFSNFTPVLEKGAFLPVDETTQLDARDYAAAFSGALGAVVHFSVAGRPAALIAPLASVRTPGEVDSFLASSIAGKNGTTDGMYIVLGANRAPDGFQCGWDLPPTPPGDPEDAYQSALDTSGQLGGSPAALQHADEALAWNLPSAGGAVDIFFTFGTSYEAATASFAAARARGGDAIRLADVAYWRNWLADAAFPPTSDPDRDRIAKRALLAIAVGRDSTSSAIVASVASQPPYNLDWPRDGAFIDYALDVAGYHDLAEKHRLFYAGVERTHDGQDVLGGGDAFPGSFAMNYYADGTPGGPIPLEIDEVGEALWADYSHATFLDEPARTAYLTEIYPAMARAADLLTSCVDPSTGLQCLENEDDNPTPTITLHGAIPTRMGLASAIRAAKYLGHMNDARRWRDRLDTVDSAIEEHFGDPALGYVGGDTSLVDVGAVGAVAWTLWPGQLHAFTDPRMQAAASQIVATYRPFFDQSNGGGSYLGKGLVALALFYGPSANGGIGDATGEAMVQRWIDLLVKEVPTVGTGHYGESFIYDGAARYTDVVCVPHLWEGALAYLALMAAYAPDQMVRADLASLDVPPPPGCAVSPAPEPRGGTSILISCAVLLALAFALAIAVRLRR